MLKSEAVGWLADEVVMFVWDAENRQSSDVGSVGDAAILQGWCGDSLILGGARLVRRVGGLWCLC
jgi:hypothetical protein